MDRKHLESRLPVVLKYQPVVSSVMLRLWREDLKAMGQEKYKNGFELTLAP